MSAILSAAAHSAESSSTSAGSPMRRGWQEAHIEEYVILLNLSSTDVGTASQEVDTTAPERLQFLLNTSSGSMGTAEDHRRPDSGAAIMELRQLTGLTWEQVARLFGVARRSLHFWASGKPLNATNEERLYRILAAMREVDRGIASENRRLLLGERGGRIPLDLLAAGQSDEFVALVGSGPGRRRGELPPLSTEEQDARKPLPPEILAGALQDTAHRDVGRGRAARSVKAPRRGPE